MRPQLVRVSSDEHTLAVSQHHSTTEAWSTEILQREWAHLYSAQTAGTPVSPPPMHLQYGDYALWQRERLAADRLDGLLQYWRRQLADCPRFELPADRPHPHIRTENARIEVLSLEAVPTERLRPAGSESRATLAKECLEPRHAIGKGPGRPVSDLLGRRGGEARMAR